MAPLPNVLVTRNDIPKEGVELLQKKCNVQVWDKPGIMPRTALLELIKGKDGLYCTPKEKIDDELLDAAGPSLKVIGTYSAGYDHVDIEVCKKRCISLGYTPGVLTDACAEMAITLLLASSRRLMEATQVVLNGGWNETALGPLWMCGKSIAGSTVGIVGLGRIGFGIAERLKAFKTEKILYCGNNEKSEASKIGAEFVPFHDLLARSDFVICCAPLSPQTARVFNLDAFKRMKSSAIFVNISRGGLVDHEDLYTALASGIILAAGLDVADPEPLPYDHKLIKLKNVVISPHIASATVESRTAMAVRAAQNVLAGLEGKPLPSPLF